MKILLVGSDLPMSIERIYAKYLRELGAEVNHFTAPDMVFDWHSKKIINKVLFRTGINRGYASVNRQLTDIVYSWKPDITWVFKGMELYPRTLAALKGKTKLVNYNPDHPYIIVSRGSGNKNVTDSVPLYDMHFCYHSGLIQKIRNQFNIPAVFLPFGFEMTEEDYEAAVGQPEINRICFLGNPDKIRESTILELADNGFAADVYGHGWDKTAVATNSAIKVHDAVYGEGFWKKLRQYRVQINIFREHNAGSHNMRTFEVPAVGGIQLLPYSEEQTAFFEDGREVFFYRNPQEMLEQAQRLLSLPAQQAHALRVAARKRSVESGYRYSDRARTVFENCKLLLDGKLVVQH